MASISTIPTEVLTNDSRQSTAGYIHAECSNLPPDSGCPQSLSELLDVLLNPSNAIDDGETIEWCKYLMASGRTPEEFAKTGTVRVHSHQQRE